MQQLTTDKELDIVQESPTNEIVRDALEVYGSYVLEDRALADVRDGLKPVQRRILWALWSMKRSSSAIPIKCATVVGEVTGKYHPHGDEAAYGALVTMSWLREPLVEQHGNFGNRNSLVETSYANKRYTETRLSSFADRQFEDVEVVPRQKSFTEEHEEPEILPARAPLLLINGSLGVAVGLSANIPPHNPAEIIEATKYLLRNPTCSLDDLLKFVRGPDYGRGVLLSKKDELQELYGSGRGKLRFSCQYKIEEGTKKGTQRLVVTSFAPEFRNKRFLDETVKLQEQKLLTMAAYDDGSLETGTRVIVEFKDPKIVQDRLLPLLETSVSYQMYALEPSPSGSGKIPKIFNLKEMLWSWIEFRREVETKVLKTKLSEIEKKIATEQARYRAISKIDDVVSVLKSAKTAESANKKLQKALKISEQQAASVLGMSLSVLMRANISAVKKRGKELLTQSVSIKKDLKDIDSVVEGRLIELGAAIEGTKRGTRLGKTSAKLDNLGREAIFIAATEDGKIERFSGPPVQSKAAWKYLDLLLVDETVTLISDQNVGQQIDVSYLDKIQDSGRLLGIASDRHEYVIVLTRNGRYVAFPVSQKRSKYPVVRKLETGDNLEFAVGVKSGDVVWVQYDDGSIQRISAQGSAEDIRQITFTKPNVLTKSLGARGRTLVCAWVQREGESLFLENGDEIGGDVEELPVECKIFRIAEHNIAISDSGNRSLVNYEDAVLRAADLVEIVPVEIDDEENF